MHDLLGELSRGNSPCLISLFLGLLLECISVITDNDDDEKAAEFPHQRCFSVVYDDKNKAKTPNWCTYTSVHTHIHITAHACIWCTSSTTILLLCKPVVLQTNCNTCFQFFAQWKG